MGDDASPTRVLIQHFALPRYRVPVFQTLAEMPEFEVEVVYGSVAGLTNVAVPGVITRPARTWRLRTPLGSLVWDRDQWAAAGRHAADVAVLTWNVRSVSLAPALLRARRNSIGTVLWGHGASRRDSPFRRRVRNAVGGLADAVVFYSDRVAERYSAATSRRESVFVARNTIDQRPIQRARQELLANPERLERFRADNGLAGRPLLLFVSRFKRENRLEVLVEAVARLRARYPGLMAVLVGEALADDSQVTRLVDRLDLSESVRFVGPIYADDRLAPWFMCADLFCYPSNLGLSVLHAFGYGLPVVTGDREEDNPPEWSVVRDGVNGVLFSAGDPDSLADAIGRLLGDSEARRKLGESALRDATEVYTLEAMVSGLADAIRYAAARRSSRAGVGGEDT